MGYVVFSSCGISGSWIAYVRNFNGLKVGALPVVGRGAFEARRDFAGEKRTGEEFR